MIICSICIHLMGNCSYFVTSYLQTVAVPPFFHAFVYTKRRKIAITICVIWINRSWCCCNFVAIIIHTYQRGFFLKICMHKSPNRCHPHMHFILSLFNYNLFSAIAKSLKSRLLILNHTASIAAKTIYSYFTCDVRTLSLYIKMNNCQYVLFLYCILFDCPLQGEKE